MQAKINPDDENPNSIHTDNITGDYDSEAVVGNNNINSDPNLGPVGNDIRGCAKHLRLRGGGGCKGVFRGKFHKK